jgi:hypothetical protein
VWWVAISSMLEHQRAYLSGKFIILLRLVHTGV